MNNWESCKDDVLKNVASFNPWGIDRNGSVFSCNEGKCENGCIFSKSDNCVKARKRWLDAEKEVPKPIDWNNDIDWDHVPVDTPVLVNDDEDNEWRKRYFAGKRSCDYLVWSYGGTSFSGNSKTSWKHCQLARPEDVEKYWKKEDGNE